MASLSLRSLFDRGRWMTAADCFAVGVGATLPWSTSATGIFIALCVVAVLPTLEVGAVRQALRQPAAALPVALWLLAALGTLWADVGLAERLENFGSFHRLLVISLLLVHFRRSARGMWVLYGFLVSSTVQLVASWGLVLIPGLHWRGREFGVPAKDYIFQSSDFLICAFALLGYAIDAARARHVRPALAAAAVALAFLANMFFVVTSRTALLVVPVLLLCLGFREFRWKGLAAALGLGVAVAAAVWFASPYLRDRLTTTMHEFDAYRLHNEANSTGLHLEFLRKSWSFVRDAPVLGHGTGSIVEQFHKSERGHDGASAYYADNPHNQIFAIAIQLGLIGAALLVAMWVAHLSLFIGRGGLVAWIGVVVVVQNIISSLFNSHLFDFTSGWLYVFGVGVAGGMTLRQRDKEPTSALSPSRVS